MDIMPLAVRNKTVETKGQFLICYATADMINRFQDYPTIVAIDGTHKTCGAGYHLVTVLVFDARGEGTPVFQCLMETENKAVFSVALKTLQSVAPNACTNVRNFCKHSHVLALMKTAELESQPDKDVENVEDLDCRLDCTSNPEDISRINSSIENERDMSKEYGLLRLSQRFLTIDTQLKEKMDGIKQVISSAGVDRDYQMGLIDSLESLIDNIPTCKCPLPQEVLSPVSDGTWAPKAVERQVEPPQPIVALPSALKVMLCTSANSTNPTQSISSFKETVPSPKVQAGTFQGATGEFQAADGGGRQGVSALGQERGDGLIDVNLPSNVIDMAQETINSWVI
ncbi:hypothetical protein TCAL_14550 [Tigriopus californicus]|uniref:ZSWIM1/3 RNaseH-like domain-containing protein n=1 Tax=Tigriopus californicus TaxID=6832 RepID=A0A553PCU1_TIGCA|nr:hypothetical protein TCAL_14550 [Tigriopus californicus]